MDETDNYIFPLKYDEQDGILLDCLSSMIVKSNSILSINKKEDLQKCYAIYKSIIENLHSNQDKWFDNTQTIDELSSIFREILRPDVENNNVCLHFTTAFSEELSPNDVIVPKIRLHNVAFDGRHFRLDIRLEDWSTETDDNCSAGQAGQEIDERESKTNNHESVNLKKDKEEVEEDIEGRDLFMPSTNPESESFDDILEVFDDINDDEHEFVRYTIKSSLKKNIRSGLKAIFDRKNITIMDEDITEILYDSDDETDDESQSGF